MGWIYLIIAGLFEVCFTTAMRHVDGSLPWRPLVLFVGSIGLSFGFLWAATQTLPIGTAYAMWVGIGAIGTVVVGIALYDEDASLIRLLLLGVLIAAIVGLKLVSGD